MKKLYEKNELLFALIWIFIYCLVLAPVRDEFGDESPWMLLALLIFALSAAVFVKKNQLEGKYGLKGWPANTRRYLYFIPMWIITTGNLWNGISPVYKGLAQVFAVVSMLLVGYVEELIFRGFLFKALISKNGIVKSIIISSVTFGLGHILNLFTGQASIETFIQIIFAVSWGFLVTMVFYKCGSLLPCILSHGLIDAFSKFAVDSHMGNWLYVVVTIIVAIFYCLYLWKLPEDNGGSTNS
ncbi:MAG: CPBP family intramembrane metalloprotease [Flexilinea sp.]|nr:CPBP family intramembrane metalloprotease [Flexilinea sp.]